MIFLKKHSDTNYIIRLHVKPNSKNQKVEDNGEFLKISLNSKPTQNKANNELINLLKKKLNLSKNQIRIISGLKSSKKLVKISFIEKMDEEDIIKKLINDY
ncbi:MAG: DUF167 domain-containing protein [Candidatus Hodarchaeota archaeon]